jgi:hypothetical protein
MLTLEYIFPKAIWLEQEDFNAVLRAAGETENIQNWLQLDEGDPGLQLLNFWFLNKGSAVTVF